MIDAALQPIMRRVLTPPARLLAAAGVGADGITIAGFAIGLLVVPALAAGMPGIALCLILLNRLLDGLDGAVARIAGPTDRGAFIDITLDFAFYALVPVGFALADPDANAAIHPPAGPSAGAAGKEGQRAAHAQQESGQLHRVLLATDTLPL